MVGLLVAFGPDCGTKVRQDIRESMREMMHYDPDRSGKTGMDFTQQMVNEIYLEISRLTWFNSSFSSNVAASIATKIGITQQDIRSFLIPVALK